VLFKIIHSLGVNSMRTLTANIIILFAMIDNTSITGTAIDGDIAVKFSVANNDVNQRLFVPEAQLVVTGRFRIANAVATIGVRIDSVVAVVSIPSSVSISTPVETIESEVIDTAPLTPAQKRAATKKAKTEKLVAV
jgi:hypothetical protein